MLRAEHAEVEAFIEKGGREWARLMLEAQFALRAELEQRVEVVGADGAERSSARSTERHLETVVGTVAVPRLGYQKRGHGDLHPMDAALNLAGDHFSFGVRHLVAKECARASFDEVVDLIRDRSGAAVAKRQVEELAVRAAHDFDAFYALRMHERDATNDLLVLSFDGKGIVMRHADLREATRLAAEQKANKLETRLSPGEKSDRKRMAQVCTVYSLAPWYRTAADVMHLVRDENTEAKRPRPTDKRVWASVEKPSRTAIRGAFEEALRRDPERRRRWVVLVDGEPRQLAYVKAEAKRAGVKVTLILDVVHVLEYLWLAGRALFGGSTQETENWVGHRLLALLTGQSGGDVAGTIRWWAKRRKAKLDASGLKALNTACRYLANKTRTRLMRYGNALIDGLPIATGVIEGACRYLVKDRMDRTGACWSLQGAESVLRLRALRASGDFDDYWLFHLVQEKARTHAARYAHGNIPDPLPAPKRHLHSVK
jgi:plasmid stabilization system protein ParE